MICWMAGRGAGFSSSERKYADFRARHRGIRENMSTIAASVYEDVQRGKNFGKKLFCWGASMAWFLPSLATLR